MSRMIVATSVILLLPASVFAYINAGFKSQGEYNRHMRDKRNPSAKRR